MVTTDIQIVKMTTNIYTNMKVATKRKRVGNKPHTTHENRKNATKAN